MQSEAVSQLLYFAVSALQSSAAVLGSETAARREFLQQLRLDIVRQEAEYADADWLRQEKGVEKSRTYLSPELAAFGKIGYADLDPEAKVEFPQAAMPKVLKPTEVMSLLDAEGEDSAKVFSIDYVSTSITMHNFFVFATHSQSVGGELSEQWFVPQKLFQNAFTRFAVRTITLRFRDYYDYHVSFSMSVRGSMLKMLLGPIKSKFVSYTIDIHATPTSETVSSQVRAKR